MAKLSEESSSRLAKWRQEREQQSRSRTRLSDLTSIGNTTLLQSRNTNGSKTRKYASPVSHSLHQITDQDIDNEPSKSSLNSSNDGEHDPITLNSIQTTPTNNTQLNAMGMQRQMNDASLDLDFPHSIQEEEEITPEKLQQEEVSLITQDTDFQNMMRPMEAVNSHPDKETRRKSNVQSVIQGLQQSLENSRKVRHEQEVELEKRQSLVEALQVENEDLKQMQRENSGNVQQQLEQAYSEMGKISTLLGINSMTETLDASSGDIHQDLEQVIFFMKELSTHALPNIIHQFHSKEETMIKLEDEIESSTKELKQIQSQIKIEKEQWKEQKAGLEKDVYQQRIELDQLLVFMKEAQMDSREKEEELTNLNIELGEKHIELEEITRLCEDKIEAAYAAECEVKEQIELFVEKEEDLNTLAQEVEQKTQSLEDDEEALAQKQLSFQKEFESKNEALSLKEEELQEQQDEILRMTASLKSQELLLQQENKRVEAVKKEVLAKEAVVLENEKILDQKALDLSVQHKEITQERDELEKQSKRLDEEYSARETIIKEHETRLQEQEDDFEVQSERFILRLKAAEQAEKQLDEDRQHLSNKEKDLAQLEKKIKEREEFLESNSKDIHQERTDWECLKSRVETELKDLHSSCATKQNELTSLTKECKSASSKLQDLNKEIAKVKSSLEKKVTSAKHDLERVMENYNVKERDYKNLCKEKLQLEAEIIESRKLRDEVRKTIKTKEITIKKLQADLDDDRKSWEEQKSKDKLEIAAEKEKAKERSRLMYSDAKKSLLKRFSAMEMQQQQTTKSLEAKAKQLESLHGQLSDFQAKLCKEKNDFENCKKNSEISRIKKEVEGMEKEIQSLRTKCSDWKKEKDDLSKKLDVSKQEFSLVQDEKKNLLEKVSKRNGVIKSLESHLKKARKENKDILKEKAGLENRNHTSSCALEELEKINSALKKENNEISDNLSKIAARLTMLEEVEKEKITALDRIKRLEAMLEDKEASSKSNIEELQSELKTCTQNLTNLENERDNLQKQIMDDELASASLHTKMEKVCNQYVMVVAEKKEMMSTIECLKKEISDFQKISASTKEMEEIRSEIQNERISLDSEKKKQLTKAKKLKELQSELKAKLSNVAVSEKKLKEFAKLMQKQSKDLKAKENQIQSVTEALNGKSVAETGLISELQQMLQVEQTRNKDLLEKYTKLQSDLEAKHFLFDSCGDDMSVEERIQQMALRIKEKDDELTQKELDIDQRLLKCNAYEERLLAWQGELECLAQMCERDSK